MRFPPAAAVADSDAFSNSRDLFCNSDVEDDCWPDGSDVAYVGFAAGSREFDGDEPDEGCLNLSSLRSPIIEVDSAVEESAFLARPASLPFPSTLGLLVLSESATAGTVDRTDGEVAIGLPLSRCLLSVGSLLLLLLPL